MNLCSRYSLYVVLGIILNNACLNTAGAFRRPVSGADARFSELQKQLSAIRDDIDRLNAAASVGDNLEDLKNRLTVLENQLQSVTEKLNDERRQNAELKGEYDKKIAELEKERDDAQGDLFSLKNTLNKAVQRVQVEFNSLQNTAKTAVQTVLDQSNSAYGWAAQRVEVEFNSLQNTAKTAVQTVLDQSNSAFGWVNKINIF